MVVDEISIVYIEIILYYNKYNNKYSVSKNLVRKRSHLFTKVKHSMTEQL